MKTRWFILLIVLVLGIMLAAGWLQRPKTPPSQPEQIHMQTYKDPGKAYTVSVPTTWKTTTSTATNTTGLNTTNPEKQTIQITQFTKPAEMGVTVQVIGGQPTCPLAAEPNTTLAGLPAFYNPANYTWTIPTTTNTVVVSIAYPGTNSFHYLQTKVKPTPFPAATINADKQLVRSILNSLTFAELKPFICSK